MARGTATCTLDGETIEIKTGESTDVAIGTPHRIANLNDEHLVVIEVQRDEYLGEDDIVRLAETVARARSRNWQ